MRRFYSTCVLFILSVTLAFGQVRIVSGKIIDENGDPVPYASIRIKNGSGGLAADANGAFKIEVHQGDVLVISTVGGDEKEIVLLPGKSVYNIVIQKQKTELSTVVVTALGIKRSAKSTTFATQQLGSDRLTQARETDLTSALAGKVAGVQVLGQAGSKLGDNGVIRLRGTASIKDKYAIYVVDGTITNALDINMDDVASVSVLKGPNATALYGQRAEGGVIVITTKKAAKGRKLQVELNQTTTAEKVNVLPDYQNMYGGGNTDTWKTFNYIAGTHPAEWAVLNGKRFHNYSTDESWGPKMDGGEYIPWYAWYPGSQYSFKTANYNAQPDNVRDFFKTGFTANNNINLSTGGEKYSARFSFTNIIRSGIIPESKQDKNTFSTQLSYDILSRLTASANVAYTFEHIEGDFGDSYGNFTTGSFNQWFHRDLDMKKMKELANFKTSTGVYASWNHADPGSSTTLSTPAFNGANFWYNPYSWLEHTSNTSARNRLVGDVSMKFKIMGDWDISAVYRFNRRNTEGESKVPQVFEKGGVQTGIFSGYAKNDSKYVEENFELISTYKKTWKNVSLDALAGANLMQFTYRDSSRSTQGGLVVPDLFQISNSVTQPPYLSAGYSDKKVMSLFGRATIGYKDFLFGDVTLRQDWSSVLPSENNGYLTPSFGASFVFSDFTKNKFPELSLGKVRASWAKIGTDDIDPYAINLVYTTSNAGYNNQYFYTAVPNTIVDPNIKPTINSAFETGLDLKFFRNRIGISTTYFYEVKKNDIVTADVASATGFTSRTLNVGQVTRQGVELQLDVVPVQTKNFTWEASFNWSRIRSVVNKVSEETKTIYVNSPGFSTKGLQFGNPPSLILPSVVHVEGEPWGQLRGFGIKRIDGKPVLSSDGLFEEEANVNFGSVLPNYTGGIFNQFTYKNLTLSATIDFQQGGKFFSLSDWFGTYTGVMERTATLNDNGVNVREPVSQGGGVHVFGVDEQGKSVDYYVDGKTYFKQFSDNSSGIADMSVFDATYTKLREVSLGYNFNIKQGKKIKKLFISAVARNPLIIYKGNPVVDPSELPGRNGENGQLPGTRSLGVNIKVGF